jgi:hypothetical protein
VRFVSRAALFAAILALGLVCNPGPAAAQTAAATASIYGDVLDAQGAAVVGAKVTITNPATQASRVTTSDESGRYQFVGLAPGVYNLKVELTGFKTATRDALALAVNTVSRLNITLEVGAVTETVIVTAEVAALNTTDASVGNVITPRQVLSLPLEARSPVMLLTLQSGVAFSGDPTDNRSGSVSGARADQVNVTLDGVDINDQQKEAGGNFSTAFNTALPVPLESIQEFRFTTSNPTTDQGRSSGGQVGFVTRSGSNEWHGSAFWTHRNTATTANDFFNNASGIERPKLLRNQYGGSIGGRVVKDRIFFFGVFEGNKRREAISADRVTPTSSLRDGVLMYACAVPGSCPGGTVAGLTGNHSVPAGYFGLTPAQVFDIDPLRFDAPGSAGVNPAMIALLNAYPACDPSVSVAAQLDGGQNFCGFRFNSPVNLNSNVWVTRWDFNITSDARHMVSFRGTLNDLVQGVTPPAFPTFGTETFGNAQDLVDNSKGYAITYTAQVTPNLTSILRWGHTRQGREFTGQAGDSLSIRSYSLPYSTVRATIRKIPTYNLVEDASWTYHNHTVQFGVNARWIRNDRQSFASSFTTFAINDGYCENLCNDVFNAMGGGVAPWSAYPAVSTGFRNPFKRALMGLYGTITQVGTGYYHFDGTNNVLAQGQPVARKFVANEFEWYVQDTWRLTRDLTVIFGLRHAWYGVPYEANGFQVQPTQGLESWFFDRVTAMYEGRPTSDNPILSWDLSGPANDRPGYYRSDLNNFAPNLSFAYTPSFSDGFFAKIFGGPGKSVIRGGFRVVFDRVGGAFVINQDQDGSFGLVSPVISPAGAMNFGGPVCGPPPVDACRAPRFNGTFSSTGYTGLPAVPSYVDVPLGGFPATPPQSFGNLLFGISENLRTPYSYAINLSYGRELGWNTAIEVGYVGRMGHKLLAKADYGAPTIYLVDGASGMNYAQAINQLYLQSERGGLPTASIIPIAYFENLFSGLAGTCFDPPGAGCSATQAAYEIASGSFPSFTDSLAALECTADLGCPTFFNPQSYSLPVWTNLAKSNYHAMQVSIRKRFSNGLLFDVNYAWARSMDNASGVENQDRLGGQIQDAFFPNKDYDRSDFDLRHQISANWVYELPFGNGKKWGSGVSTAVNQIIGGWTTSGIVRWRTGFPVYVENGFNFPTNYFLTAAGTIVCPISSNLLRNGAGGAPNLFGNDAQALAAFNCIDFTLSGEVGNRNGLQGARFFSLDFGLRKSFAMPWEGHNFLFEWQVFNVANNPNFDDRTMRVNPEGTPDRFGRYGNTIGADERGNNGRVMQFSLKYVF